MYGVAAVAVVADSQVQHQLLAETPVVLQEQSEVFHAPRERVLIGLIESRGRLVAHHILQGQVADRQRCGVGLPSSRQSEDAAKLPGVRSSEKSDLLIKGPARYRPRRAILAIKARHPRILNDGKQSPAGSRFGLVGILREPDLIDSLHKTLIHSHASLGSPAAAAERIVGAHTFQEAVSGLRVQGLRQRLLLIRMSSVVRHG